MRIRLAVLILTVVVGLVACRPAPLPVVTASPTAVQPTVQIPPTATPTVPPTSTRVPTAVPTATNTPTAAPTVILTVPPTPTTAPFKVQVDSPEVGYVNVRNAPNTGGAIVTRAQDGAVLDALEAADAARGKVGQEGQWLKIRTSDGKEGFAAAWYLRLPGAGPAPKLATPTPAPNPSLDASVDLLNRTNALRAENRLPPLRLNTKLNAAAERHSQDMSNTNNIDHIGSDRSKASQRIADTGYEAQYTGENIYGGQVTVDAAWAYWRDDPPHRANLLNAQFTEMGVSVVRGARGWYYFTMDLARPAR
jgi:uncharacterized protein YkwD